MPDDRIKISALPSALSLDNTDVLAIVQGMTGDNKETKKVAVTLIAAHLLEVMQHNNLNTSDKTIIGAINEVAETLEGLYPVADASGPIANFEPELARPLETLKVGIVATQESGTPTPSAPLSISGWSEVKVVHCKKNIFNYDENKVDVGTTTTSTTRAFYPLGFKNITLTFTAKLKEGESTTNSDYLNIGKIRKSDGLLEVLNSFVTPSDIITRTITVSGDDTVILMSLENPVVIKSILSRYDLQIEVGSRATTYEEFNGNTVSIALGGIYYGGYVTQDKDGHRQLVVTKSKVTIDGTESDSSFSIQTYETITRVEYRPFRDSGAANVNFMSDKFASEKDIEYGIWNSTSPRMFFGFPVSITTIAQAKAWFSSNNTDVVYALATPIVIDLPDGVPIETLIGVNNIFAGSGDILECKYKDTIQHYIDTQIAATQALIL